MELREEGIVNSRRLHLRQGAQGSASLDNRRNVMSRANLAQGNRRPASLLCLLSISRRLADVGASKAAAVLWRVLCWPARVAAARATMLMLGGMSDYELKDIGLTRHDLRDASSLLLDADPTQLLAERAAERRQFIR